MADNEVDQITREMRALGQAATAAIAAWRRQNPGKTRVPRKVRKEAVRELRESMRAHERLIADERRFQRASVEQMIANHRAMSLDLHRSAPGTPEQYARAQWAHAQQRHMLAEQIHAAGHLTREERGQAVMALVSAHYADDPNVRQRPVWGPKPYGMTALKARLAERVSRVQEGLEQRRENRSARKAPPRPAAPSITGVHQDRSNPMPAQDQAANARRAQMRRQDLAEEAWWQQQWAEAGATPDPILDRARWQQQQWAQADATPEPMPDRSAEIEALEQQLRTLAAERDLERRAIAERDQLRVKVTELGEKVLDARQQHKSVADQLAQRGQELTDVHAELAQVRGERDAAVRKLIEHTPPQQRYGSPERQAQQARPTPQTPKSPDATPEAPEAPETPEVPEAESAPKAPASPKRTGSRSRKSPAAPAAPEKELAGAVVGAATGGRSNGSTRRVNGSRKVVNEVRVDTPTQIGVVIENGRIKTPATAARINGSRKVTTPAAPSASEIPWPAEEPPNGFEPPEFDR